MFVKNVINSESLCFILKARIGNDTKNEIYREIIDEKRYSAIVGDVMPTFSNESSSGKVCGDRIKKKFFITNEKISSFIKKEVFVKKNYFIFLSI